MSDKDKVIIQAQKNSIRMLTARLTQAEKKGKAAMKYVGVEGKISNAYDLLQEVKVNQINIKELNCILEAMKILKEVKGQIE